MNTSAIRSKSRGFTLLEMMIVIVIAGIILVGVFGKGLFGKSSASANTEAQDITQVMAAVSGFKPYGAANSNLVPNVIGSGGVPSDWTTSGNTITNGSSGAVAITSNGPGYNFTSGGYSQATCQFLAQNVAKQGIQSTQINGGAAITGPVNAQQAQSQCVSGNTNSLTWVTNQ